MNRKHKNKSEMGMTLIIYQFSTESLFTIVIFDVKGLTLLKVTDLDEILSHMLLKPFSNRFHFVFIKTIFTFTEKVLTSKKQIYRNPSVSAPSSVSTL